MTPLEKKVFGDVITRLNDLNLYQLINAAGKEDKAEFNRLLDLKHKAVFESVKELKLIEQSVI